jgi:hypothetical protein
VLSLVLAAALILVALFYVGSKGRGARDVAAPPPVPPAAASAPTADLEAPPALQRGWVDDDPQASARTTPRADRFRGSGRVRGSVEAVGVDLPARWTLTLSPSDTLPGREHADTRAIELTAPDFDVEGLPLGGYLVEASAPGLNGSGVPVLLERGNESVYVTLHLRSAGFLEGSVLEEDGAPVADLRIELVSVRGGSSAVTRTDASGAWSFDGVADGDHRLFFGSSDLPAIAPKDLRFAAPSLRFPTVRAPHLARCTITVVDSAGNPVASARVLVEGASGRLDLETDWRGEAVAHFLSPGPHQVTATSELGARAVQLVVLGREQSALEVRYP